MPVRSQRDGMRTLLVRTTGPYPDDSEDGGRSEWRYRCRRAGGVSPLIRAHQGADAPRSPTPVQGALLWTPPAAAVIAPHRRTALRPSFRGPYTEAVADAHAVARRRNGPG